MGSEMEILRCHLLTFLACHRCVHWMMPIPALIKRTRRVPTLFMLAGVLLGSAAIAAVGPGCSLSGGGEGFAIYGVQGDTPPGSVTGTPAASGPRIISSTDVVSYNLQTHELVLTEAAFQRICELEVPVEGKSFIVCVDKQPVYAGAFWTPVSSISYDGVTIWKPYGKDGPSIVALELGYPSADFYGGADPRNDPRIASALRRAGKLVDRLGIGDVQTLPASIKGYELYSWEQDGRWRYTLITGTNRNKSTQEIISADDFISEIGWIKVSVDSLERP